MKDLGVADVILNIKLNREEGNGGITLVQNHYVEKVLTSLVIASAHLLQLLMTQAYL
jgi:hypothetical protein